ncbi:Fes1-domain-containing protein [Coprinellus micaceus]|uniref:Fes1-domain-containing protein n=1 Tax=Coprinellus micaceus TaxID=71717 RepID=A0A4Y7TJQ9_COPMI|nr:Fes1-domain-containing protein [Coprinellus micaceus]
MESLLRWSLQHSAPQDSAASDRAPATRQDLNPEIIDMLLGKPDAELMKEDVAAAVDTSKSEDERIAALDHLEMYVFLDPFLVQRITDYPDLEKLKLWEPIQSLLTSKDASIEIRVQALWVIGTALQNNPSAQEVYLSYNPLPTLLSFLTPSSESTVSARSKALYTLSGLLKHNAPAVKQLSDPGVSGWQKIQNALHDPNIGVRRKSQPIQHQPPLMLAPAPPGSTGTPNIALHPTANEPETQQIHTPDTQAASDPVHDNSHAAHLRDASRAQTSAITQDALEKYGILDSVVSSLVSPLPHGVDGENTEADHDYDEKVLRLLYTYTVSCHGNLNDSQKASIKKWLIAETSSTGGVTQLEEKYNLTSVEHADLTSKL